MKTARPLGLMFALLVAAGCGPDAQKKIETTAQEAQAAGESVRQAGEQLAATLASGTGDVSQAWRDLQAAVGLTSNAAPIAYSDLKSLLPTALNGWTPGPVTGGHEKIFGVGASRAEVSLTREDGARLTIRITDTGAMQALTALAGKAMDVAQVERESDTGFERSFAYRGHRGFETYNANGRTGSKRVLVANVFDLQVTGTGVKAEDLDQALEAIDLERLRELKLKAVGGDAPPPPSS